VVTLTADAPLGSRHLSYQGSASSGTGRIVINLSQAQAPGG